MKKTSGCHSSQHGHNIIDFQTVKNIADHGVPVVAQQLTNPTRNYEVEGSIPALPQWVKDPALL